MTHLDPELQAVRKARKKQPRSNSWPNTVPQQTKTGCGWDIGRKLWPSARHCSCPL